MDRLTPTIAMVLVLGFPLPALSQEGVDVKAWEAEIHRRAEEVRARMQNHVSLEADVAAYADFIDQRRIVSLDYLTEKYDRKSIFEEMVRQARTRQSDRFLKNVVFITQDEKSDNIRQLAVEGLNAPGHGYRWAATYWCWKNNKLLSKEEQEKALQAYRKVFFDSNGTECYEQMLDFASAQDAPRIRALYNKQYRNQTDEVAGGQTGYFCNRAFRSGRRSRSQILLILAKLGEPEAVQEIRAALAQNKDTQRRAWGIHVASRWGSKDLLPLMAKALDDKNQAAERIDFGADPQVNSSHAYRTLYTRICDLAVRAIHEIVRPDPPWPFKAPKASNWPVAGEEADTYFAFKEDLGRGWEKTDRPAQPIVNHEVVVGFTDQQIDFVRKYVAGRTAPK